MDEDVEYSGDVTANLARTERWKVARDEQLEPGQGVVASAGMDRRGGPVVAGVKGLQRVVGLLAVANLADDEPVRAHAQGVLHQVGHVKTALPAAAFSQALAVHAFQLDPMRRVQLQLSGVLDGDDAFLGWEGADQGSQQGALTGAGGSTDEHVGAAA